MTFMEHLEELRWRLLMSLGAVVAAFLLSYLFSERIFAFMIVPLKQILEPGQSPIGTGVAEAFFTEIKVALFAAVFLAGPVIFYQIWRFIAPGLHPIEKRFVMPFVFWSSLFFIGGAYFCYRVVLPFALLYFMEQYRSLGVSPEIRIGEYFTFFFGWFWPLELPLNSLSLPFSWSGWGSGTIGSSGANFAMRFLPSSSWQPF